MKVSMKQISQLTGFSPATVSNALNRKKGVNSETSDKILRGGTGTWVSAGEERYKNQICNLSEERKYY